MQEYVAHGYILEIGEPNYNQIYERSVERLSARSKLRLSRISSENRQRQFILARYLLSECLFQLTKIYYSIDYLKTGQPCIRNSNFHCSISHSANFIAIAFSNEGSIGIDIEQHRSRNFDQIVTTYFNNQEIATYQDLLKGEQMNWFYANWTRKEAAAKVTGEGISQAALKKTCTSSDIICHQTDHYSLACVHDGNRPTELFKTELLNGDPWLKILSVSL